MSTDIKPVPPPPIKPSAPSSPASDNGGGGDAGAASAFRRRPQQSGLSREELTSLRLYEEVKKALPDCAAVESIKVAHRAAGVNISDEQQEPPVSAEADIDTLIKQIHNRTDKWQRDEVEAATNSAVRDRADAERRHAAEVGAQLRVRQLEEAMARVDNNLEAAEKVQKEYRDAEEQRFAKEKAELAERTQRRMEAARRQVQLADDSAQRREQVQKFLDHETKTAELVFRESVERQNARKEEETRRLEVFRAMLESRHYLTSIADLRSVVRSAWVEGVSTTDEWKSWATRLGGDMRLDSQAVAEAVAGTPRKS